MMGIGLEDLESEEGEEGGHNADNESLASYLSGALASFPDNDHIPTRDTGTSSCSILPLGGPGQLPRQRPYTHQGYRYW